MTVREHRLVPATLLFLVGIGCGTDPAAPAPSTQAILADSVLMAPGAEVAVGILRLSFLEVSSDSRCPVDVVCIWQGNAAVEIAVGLGEGPSHPKTLNTSEGMPAVDFNGFRVTLLDLQPAPRAGVAIPPEDYRARFRVEALADST
ncbi:MAG: hypothetical protein OEW56_05520 [Gemmatimonadota bacterium]|nr:hypothetical protein [Gemmatimonadota bacterium]